MKWLTEIRITLHSLVRVTVARRPHWLARLLLGRQPTEREARRIDSMGGLHAWVYGDNHEVEPAVRREIERAMEGQ